MAPPVPASSSGPKICNDLNPIDLKPFQELPKRSELKAEDQTSKPLQVFYEKVGAYLLIDSKDNGIGNGNGLLEAAEVDQFFAKYKSRDPKVNTCSLMTEARDFAKVAPQLIKAFRDGRSLSKEFESSKESSEKDLPLFQIGLGILVLGLIARKIVQRFRQGPPSGGAGGSGGTKESSTPKKVAKVIPMKRSDLVHRSADQGDAMIHSAAVYLGTEVDLSSQIQKLYGGTHPAEVSNSKTPAPVSTAFPTGTFVPGVVPLLSPGPLTLPTLRSLPVVRPMIPLGAE